MSGVELFLFVDGGVTVTALLGAVGSRIGITKKRQSDAEELATLEEIPGLLAEMKGAQRAVSAGSTALTSAWRAPLSLFNSRDQIQAIERGVDLYHLKSVLKVKYLLSAARGSYCELLDLADVYTSQLQQAAAEGSSGKGLERDPVLELTKQLKEMALRMELLIPDVEAARQAFDESMTMGRTRPAPEVSFLEVQTKKEQLQCASDDIVEALCKSCVELPVCILRDRSGLRFMMRTLTDKDAFVRLIYQRKRFEHRLGEDWVIGPAPTEDDLQIGERCAFVATTFAKYCNLFEHNEVVDVLRLRATEAVAGERRPGVEIIRHDLSTTFWVHHEDLRKIVGPRVPWKDDECTQSKACENIKPGTRCLFLRSNDYLNYPEECVDKEFVAVLKEIHEQKLVQVRWDSGYTYIVKHQDLRMGWRTRCMELQSSTSDRIGAAQALAAFKEHQEFLPQLGSALLSAHQERFTELCETIAGTIGEFLGNSDTPAKLLSALQSDDVTAELQDALHRADFERVTRLLENHSELPPDVSNGDGRFADAKDVFKEALNSMVPRTAMDALGSSIMSKNGSIKSALDSVGDRAANAKDALKRAVLENASASTQEAVVSALDTVGGQASNAKDALKKAVLARTSVAGSFRSALGDQSSVHHTRITPAPTLATASSGNTMVNLPVDVATLLWRTLTDVAAMGGSTSKETVETVCQEHGLRLDVLNNVAEHNVETNSENCTIIAYKLHAGEHEITIERLNSFIAGYQAASVLVTRQNAEPLLLELDSGSTNRFRGNTNNQKFHVMGDLEYLVVFVIHRYHGFRSSAGVAKLSLAARERGEQAVPTALHEFAKRPSVATWYMSKPKYHSFQSQ